MPNTFNYVKQDGSMGQFQADTPDQALGSMPSDADPNSGVQLNNLVVTSRPAKIQGMKDSTELTRALSSFGLNEPTTVNSTTDKTNDISSTYMSTLEKIAKQSDLATRNVINEINRSKMESKKNLDTQYDNYKRGLQLLGIQSNTAQSTPDLLMGHIQEAENQHQTKLQDLDSKVTKALLEAETARSKNDLEMLNTKMKYVKELKDAQKEEIKNYYDTLNSTTKAADIQAHQIYDTLNTLNDDEKEQFLLAVSKKFKLPIGTLMQALQDEQLKRETADVNLANKKRLLKGTSKSTGSVTGTAGKGGTDGTFSYSPQDLIDYKSFLNQGGTGPDGTYYSPRGTDGYVDPGAYNAIYTDWKKKGGTLSGFLKKFPIESVNPEGYEMLVADLKPKKKSSRSS
jgi:hypothetical protein